MYCLSSKTYLVKHADGIKLSAKGVMKRQVTNPEQIFPNVLSNRKSEQITNIGFRPRDNTIFTYNQKKQGFHIFTASVKFWLMENIPYP